MVSLPYYNEAAHMDDLPIACSLTAEQLQERRRELLEPLRACVVHVESLPDGYAYVFPASSGLWMRLAQLVDLERECCRFLNFALEVSAASNTIRLVVTGGADAKPAIQEFFG